MNAVILSGPVSDPAPYYAISDALVLPSHREGLPTVVLERTPRESRDRRLGYGHRRSRDARQNGPALSRGHVSALADAIAMLVTNKKLAAKLGRAGQEQGEARFSTRRDLG